jgi:hypothetical protein
LLFPALLAVAQAVQPTTPPQPSAPPPKPYDCSAPEYRQFDFWVGEWEVTGNPATRPATAPPPRPGRKPAVNIVERAQSGCVVIENWDDGSGGTGQSYNLFDRTRRLWHQTWVDNGGGLHQYWGEFKNGSMVLQGEVPLPPVSTVQGRRTIRVTFTPMGPDGMRQFSESLNVDGTWSRNYDLIYKRRPTTK